MEYFIEKRIPTQIKKLYQAGGQFQKAAERVKQIIGDINLNAPDPLKDISKTNHGESRIKNCIKYDLSGFARLITISHDGICVLMYLGDHEDCEKWLESRKGVNLAFDKMDKVMVEVIVSEDINDPDKRQYSESDYADGKLHKRLKSLYFNKIANAISYSTLSPFLDFESDVSDDDLMEACISISTENIQSVFMDVFSSLKKGDIDGAINRILLFEEDLKLLEEASLTEKEAIISNDQFIKLSELEAEYIKGILESKDWYDWMLFLHPSQREVVKVEFAGSSRLLGVSGSGKTCVLVHRAVRLAKKYSGEKILILTLNPSLSELIEKLVDLLLENTGQTDLRKSIEITSFWELCRDLLIKFDGHPLRERIFNAKSDKHDDTIDDIWEEYYKCHLNNGDAEVLFPIHQTLLLRGIYPQEYLKQEFDWTRSAFGLSNRNEYLTVEREGRKIPMAESDRKYILEGLKGWDKKMEDVGAIDYLGLANKLSQHLDKIKPIYRCVLVDEIQDFGTLELKIIRRVVGEGENDLFLTGDIAQQVYNKHHKIKNAGINIPSNAYLKILKNYRNSREILESAYAVFKDNVRDEDFKSDDFEILNPEYANFSSPKPFIRRGESVENEIFSAFEYLRSILVPSSKEKGCIAFCGYSIFEVEQLSKQINIPVLDGMVKLSEGSIFLSDLEQTKRFEFDRMIIINCRSNVFPNPSLPKEEWYREISKIYVAMTRAKKELIISYTGEVSSLFVNKGELFREDEWRIHLIDNPEILFEIPDKAKENMSKQKMGSLKGKEFLYTHNAIGLSRELQNKLLELVSGNSVIDEKRRQIGWRTMGELETNLKSRNRDLPTLKRIFGPSVFDEVENLFGIVKTSDKK